MLNGASLCVVTVPASAGLSPFKIRRTCAAFGERPPSLLPLPPGCFTARAEIRAAPPSPSSAPSSTLPASYSREDGVLLVESSDVTVQVYLNI